jgi:BON domain
VSDTRKARKNRINVPPARPPCPIRASRRPLAVATNQETRYFDFFAETRRVCKNSVLLFPRATIAPKSLSHDREPFVMSTATLSTPLFERIHEALTANPHVPRQVRVEAADGHVVLKGSVRSFFEKQMAQEAIRRVDGVQMIDNLLEVNWV